jgi:hypothetical protein
MGVTFSRRVCVAWTVSLLVVAVAALVPLQAGALEGGHSRVYDPAPTVTTPLANAAPATGVDTRTPSVFFETTRAGFRSLSAAAGGAALDALDPLGLASAEEAEAAEDAEGIVYLRSDAEGGQDYVGQAKSEARFLARQSEHARANPDADFSFEILGRAEPGEQLDRLEQFEINQRGGPTNASNPDGGLANARNQMNPTRYHQAGGDF